MVFLMKKRDSLNEQAEPGIDVGQCPAGQSQRLSWNTPKLTRLDVLETKGGKNAPPERGNHQPFPS